VLVHHVVLACYLRQLDLVVRSYRLRRDRRLHLSLNLVARQRLSPLVRGRVCVIFVVLDLERVVDEVFDFVDSLLLLRLL
jgi:hypothetical protein